MRKVYTLGALLVRPPTQAVGEGTRTDDKDPRLCRQVSLVLDQSVPHAADRYTGMPLPPSGGPPIPDGRSADD